MNSILQCFSGEALQGGAFRLSSADLLNGLTGSFHICWTSLRWNLYPLIGLSWLDTFTVLKVEPEYFIIATELSVSKENGLMTEMMNFFKRNLT